MATSTNMISRWSSRNWNHLVRRRVFPSPFISSRFTRTSLSYRVIRTRAGNVRFAAAALRPARWRKQCRTSSSTQANDAAWGKPRRKGRCAVVCCGQRLIVDFDCFELLVFRQIRYIKVVGRHETNGRYNTGHIVPNSVVIRCLNKPLFELFICKSKR